jgi:hypothetical protein
MNGPEINIPSENSDREISVVNRNPHWIVCFVRFEEPCAMYSGKSSEAFKTTEKLLVVENDCINLTISNKKSSFAKTCNLTMRTGEVWYQNAVSPGDWVFVWMVNSRQESVDIMNIVYTLAKSVRNDEKLSANHYNSGLKFVGRVIGLGSAISVQSNGVISITQNVSCQAFLEMANSVYYTYIAQELMTGGNPDNKAEGSQALTQQNLRSLGIDSKQEGKNGMEKAMTNIADKFLGIAKSSGAVAPEEMIALMFILIMGVDKEDSVVNVIQGLSGSFSDAIGVPKEVAKILKRPNKTKLWQMYNVILGLQTYQTNKELHRSLFPNLDSDSANLGRTSVFFKTPFSTKGSVPLQIPPIWDNRSLWQIMSSFLNDVVNEMYTCLRVNKFNEIVPTLIVREKPFGTGMYNKLDGKATTFSLKSLPKGTEKSPDVDALKKKLDENREKNKKLIEQSEKKQQLQEEEVRAGLPLKQRAFYCNLPRWTVPDEKIISFSFVLDENRRVNFVQVWGRASSVEYSVGQIWDQETFKQAQYFNKNFVADESDIARSGLRADVKETLYDIRIGETGSLSNVFARMRADWLFNGHLKPSGTITLMGIQEPICEGDNIEFNGIVFHITGVNHQASLNANGIKSFITTLEVENGILARSLKSPNDQPQYPRNFGQFTDSVNAIYDLKGRTDVQNTGEAKDRDDFGEKIPNTDKKK